MVTRIFRRAFRSSIIFWVNAFSPLPVAKSVFKLCRRQVVFCPSLPLTFSFRLASEMAVAGVSLMYWGGL